MIALVRCVFSVLFAVPCVMFLAPVGAAEAGAETALLVPEEQMRAAFDVYDRDADGVVSEQELAQTLEAFGQRRTAEEISVLLWSMDPNGDGFSDFYEFRRFSGRLLGDQDDQTLARRAFTAFDDDGNGQLSRDELIDVLSRLGLEPRPEEVDSYLRARDGDGDESLDFEEFRKEP